MRDLAGEDPPGEESAGDGPAGDDLVGGSPGFRLVEQLQPAPVGQPEAAVIGQPLRPAGGDPLPSLRGPLGRILPADRAQRALVWSVFALAAGGGMLLGSSTLYLTRIVGMSTVQVGLGLTGGSAIGLAAGPFIGHLADRRGPREVHIATMLCGAVATAGFVLVRNLWALVLVALLTALVSAAAQASRAPLIRALAGDRSTWFLSYQRAVMNVGIMLGVLVSTAGIQVDTGPVYVVIILAGAGSFVAAAAVLTRVPHVRPLPAVGTERRWLALTDRPYLSVTLVNGAMSLHLAIPVFALPLWIADNTSVPRAAITGAIVINGLLIVALQVRLSRGVVDPRSAARRMRWAGAALLAACALIGATADRSRWTALLVLLAAIVVYTLGELWHAAASFELAFGLALPHAQGQYAGVFGLGQGAANAMAPALLAALCLDRGLPGWLAMGGLLGGFGLLTPPVVRWAERRRLDERGAISAV